MHVTKLKFMKKRTQVKWLGDSSNSNEDGLDSHEIKKMAAPHPDLFTACKTLIPHLLVNADLKSGNNYDIDFIEFNENEEKESITVRLKKHLEDGRRCIIDLPAIEVKDKLVEPVQELTEEIISYAKGEKAAQLKMDLEGQQTDQNEETGQHLVEDNLPWSSGKEESATLEKVA